MGEIGIYILQEWGPWGLLFGCMAWIIYTLTKNCKDNWGNNSGNSKIELLGEKIDGVEYRLENQIDKLDQKLIEYHQESIDRIKSLETKTDRNDQIVAREQSLSMVSKGYGGKLSRTLRYFCNRVNCDHIFLGTFHNGTMDLRGIHYCKFDIMIDEFKDPLHLRANDTDFQPLYKDENILAYGDLPYNLTHVDSVVFDVDEGTLFELSDTLYRRCKSRDIKLLGLSCVRDTSGHLMGFVGAVNYDNQKINEEELKACAREIENIYK